RPARIRDPAGARRRAAMAGAPAARRTAVGLVVRPQRRGTDPARRVHRQGRDQGPVIYEIIFVVVAFSVIVQGGTVPGLARTLKIPLHTIEPEPWSLGIRFQEEPQDLHRFLIIARAAAANTP